MDFNLKAGRSGGFKVFELCPECKARLEITDKRVILQNKEIECISCGHKFKLGINKES